MPDHLLMMMTALFFAFAFAFGACFGSFLNVVVWRMPRGIPIGWTRSHCPKCQHALLSQDNIPIVGWMRLRGKCRFCGLPISLRYPLVETGVASLFGALFLLILVSHGQSLPSSSLSEHHLNWLSEFPACPLLAVYLHQCVLGYWLLALWLIDEDRQTAPWGLLGGALIAQGLLIWWRPLVGQLDLLGQLPLVQQEAMGSYLLAAKQTGFGLIMAGILASLNWGLKLSQRSQNGLLALCVLGAFLGPTFVLLAFLIAGSSLLFQQISQRFTRKKHVVSGLPQQLFWAWFLLLCTWRWWPQVAWPGLP